MNTQGASFNSNLGVFLPIPDGENANLLVILGAALGTQDGKQICFLTYKVVTKEGENDYRFYCNKLDLVSVMKGKGCTLADRVDYLQKQNAIIDVQSFVQYAMLRTILSQQLQKEPFGCFNIQFLRRRYYAPFLRELAKSEFARYLDFFIESVQIRHYWQFFKK